MPSFRSPVKTQHTYRTRSLLSSGLQSSWISNNWNSWHKTVRTCEWQGWEASGPRTIPIAWAGQEDCWRTGGVRIWILRCERPEMPSFCASPLTGNKEIFGSPSVLTRFLVLYVMIISSQNTLKANSWKTLLIFNSEPLKEHILWSLLSLSWFQLFELAFFLQYF